MNNHKIPIFSIIFVESALECITFLPKHERGSLKLQHKGKKPLKKTILDVSIHNHLMNNLPEKNKRGRPDIIHTALLLALGARLNKQGYLQIYIHTRNDEIITINPEVRIPRNYNRFVGLMEQLFEVKTIPSPTERPLLALTSQTLEDLLHHLEPDLILLFTENAPVLNKETIQNLLLEKIKVVILIGGFPHSDFSEKVYKIPAIKVSIYSEPLDTLVVLSYVIQLAEETLKLFEK